MTKKISTPIKPPGNHWAFIWNNTTDKTAIARKPSMCGLYLINDIKAGSELHTNRTRDTNNYHLLRTDHGALQTYTMRANPLFFVSICIFTADQAQ